MSAKHYYVPDKAWKRRIEVDGHCDCNEPCTEVVLASDYDALKSQYQQEQRDLNASLKVAAAFREASHDLEQQRDALQQRVAAWQPIETAPKDGKSYLFFGRWKGGEFPGGGQPCVRIFSWSSYSSASNGKHEWIGDLTAMDKYHVDFTHWMPLPAPPLADAEKQG